MRSPSLPSSRWSALKTRTQWHRRGERSPRGKPMGTDGKNCGIDGGTSVGYFGEPGVLRDHSGLW